jgi:predicted lipoprotein
MAVVIFLTAAVFSSCSDDDPADNIPAASFDRKAMLTEVAEELIIPNFTELRNSVNTLSQATNDFVGETNSTNLEVMRNAWIEAAVDHQHCSAFGFGPAAFGLGGYAKVLGVYPVDTDRVETIIADQNLNSEAFFLETVENDIRGFYTVEYLIFGSGESDADLIAGFGEDRKKYLSLAVNQLQSTFESIVNEWNNSYLQDFTSNDGIAKGTPMQLYYNGFVQDYENIKNFKLELPGGLIAGESADPSLVEAFYSGISGRLIAENWENSKNIYFGRSRDGSEITGFDEYVASVEGGQTIVQETAVAIDAIDEDVAALPPDPLSASISDQAIADLASSLQNNTANFKANIFSLLGLEVSFNSGDGD